MLSLEAIHHTLTHLTTDARRQIRMLMEAPTETHAVFVRGYLACLLAGDIVDDETHRQANLLVSTIVFNARIVAAMNEKGM